MAYFAGLDAFRSAFPSQVSLRRSTREIALGGRDLEVVVLGD